MAPPAIEVRGLKRYFTRDAHEVRALDGIDLAVAEGAFLALMGPSGSGKTTLLNILAGLDRPTAGSVVVAGADVGSLSERDLTRWRAARIGFIFQFYNLIPVLTAAENVEMPLLLTRLPRAERLRRVATALRIVGLEDRAGHLPRQLSGGEEQRVGIARALVADPRVLLADEPTGDLDQRSAAAIMDLLASLNRDLGKTIVMVTHDPKAAARASLVAHLDKGILARAPAPAGPDPAGAS
jgi:putative ABC transport system ATP-binding protein